MIFAQKIKKIPELLHDFLLKNARIFHNICPKNIFPAAVETAGRTAATPGK